MILLDGLDKQDDSNSPKLVDVASSSISPVARAHTPTPSLPDYEASQAQLRPTTLSYSEIQQKRTRRRRFRRYSIYALAAYFVLTVVVGIPIIVVQKLKRKTVVKANPYTSWEDNTPVPPKTVTLGDAPLRISAAKSCNAWNVKDRPDGSTFVSELEYHIPVNGSVFLNTNITYSSNTSYLDQFSGSLLVTVNDDVSVSYGVVYVTMHHTSKALGNATNVCLMETGTGGGLYIFAPKNLTISDNLVFNVTLLLPQNHTYPRNIPSLLCHLPHFEQTYQQFDPQITFGSVTFGGAMSGVYVESLQADVAIVKASSGEIRGTFKVTSQVSLETVSAPINADVHLYNDRTEPTFMHLTTGNSPLNANVTLYLPPAYGGNESSSMTPPHYPPQPQFWTHAETFNAPLNVSVSHDVDSVPADIRLRAVNNLGNTRVSLDSKYEGTFDVTTMFSQADVVTWDGTDFDDHYGDDADSDSDDSYGDDDDVMGVGKVLMLLPSSTTTSTGAEASATRCLQYDLISSSEIQGWVGIPPRPSPMGRRKYVNQSHVDVVSSLNGAQLVLGP